MIVGGPLDIHSAPGQGTEVHAKFPRALFPSAGPGPSGVIAEALDGSGVRSLALQHGQHRLGEHAILEP